MGDEREVLTAGETYESAQQPSVMTRRPRLEEKYEKIVK